eukprot:TRINITY_DN8581_c0_g1_i3.p1 TRINITY_DN8581_c0_g1~~TRINITY_DN8581_c0_g1_i3.p1  ORF type:complete len:271 (-),score=53.12 TRINITY_DN8581_c0_g1_i3:54-866(-)
MCIRDRNIKMKFLLVSILACAITSIFGLSISMDNSRNFYCFKTEVKNGKVLAGSVMISGDKEEENTIRIYSPSFEIVEEYVKKSQCDFKVAAQDKIGNYSICVENLSRTKKTLTINYYTYSDGKNSEEANIVERLDEKVRSLYFSLNDVSSNLEKLRTREAVHYDMIKSSNSSVMWWNIIKIAAFILVSCIEVYMITDFFNKQEKRREGFRKSNFASQPSSSLIDLSLIHISEPTRPLYISYAVFCLKKKKKKQTNVMPSQPASPPKATN